VGWGVVYCVMVFLLLPGMGTSGVEKTRLYVDESMGLSALHKERLAASVRLRLASAASSHDAVAVMCFPENGRVAEILMSSTSPDASIQHFYWVCSTSLCASTRTCGMAVRAWEGASTHWTGRISVLEHSYEDCQMGRDQRSGALDSLAHNLTLAFPDAFRRPQSSRIRSATERSCPPPTSGGTIELFFAGDSESDFVAQRMEPVWKSIWPCVANAEPDPRKRRTLRVRSVAEANHKFVELFDHRVSLSLCVIEKLCKKMSLPARDEAVLNHSYSSFGLASDKKVKQLQKKYSGGLKILLMDSELEKDVMHVVDGRFSLFYDPKDDGELWSANRTLNMIVVERNTETTSSAVARMSRILFNTGVRKIVLSTSSPFTRDAHTGRHHPMQEMLIMNRGMDKLHRMGGIIRCPGHCVGPNVLEIAIFRWHLLVCPAFDSVDTCPQNAHGFDEILPDKIHPKGESGMWLAAQVLAMDDIFQNGEDRFNLKILQPCIRSTFRNGEILDFNRYFDRHYFYILPDNSIFSPLPGPDIPPINFSHYGFQ